MDSISILRRLIREEIGRNYRTLDNTPHTFEDFQDYDIEITGTTTEGFLLDVFYKNSKLHPTQKFLTYSEAQHASRMIVDRDRVSRMNNEEKEARH